MTRCDCDAGSNANGWHEIRGPYCAYLDRQAWATFIARVPAISRAVANANVDQSATLHAGVNRD